MNTLRLGVGALLVLTGVVWILQGFNILPGSFMTGDLRWALAGAVALGIGTYLLVGRRQPADGPE